MKRFKIALRSSALVLLLAAGIADAKVVPNPCYQCYLIFVACSQNLNNSGPYCYQLWQECAAALNCSD